MWFWRNCLCMLSHYFHQIVALWIFFLSNITVENALFVDFCHFCDYLISITISDFGAIIVTFVVMIISRNQKIPLWSLARTVKIDHVNTPAPLPSYKVIFLSPVMSVKNAPHAIKLVWNIAMQTRTWSYSDSRYRVVRYGHYPLSSKPPNNLWNKKNCRGHPPTLMLQFRLRLRFRYRLRFRLRLRFRFRLRFQLGLGLGLSLGVGVKVSKRHVERTKKMKISEINFFFIPRTWSILTFLMKISLQHTLPSLTHEALFESTRTRTHRNTNFSFLSFNTQNNASFSKKSHSTTTAWIRRFKRNVPRIAQKCDFSGCTSSSLWNHRLK